MIYCFVFQIPIVYESYIFDCIDLKKKLPFTDYEIDDWHAVSISILSHTIYNHVIDDWMSVSHTIYNCVIDDWLNIECMCRTISSNVVDDWVYMWHTIYSYVIHDWMSVSHTICNYVFIGKHRILASFKNMITKKMITYNLQQCD